jgi:putative transposon-encoded protein
MRKIIFHCANEIKVSNIEGYFERVVTKFGTGAKIDAPKDYLGKKVVVLVVEERASKPFKE